MGMRYNEARFKASHNSYDREDLSITQQLQWSNVDPHHGGCRGLELDLVQRRLERDGDPWRWSVSHGGRYNDAADKQFHYFLKILRTWAERHPSHQVVTLTLDLKSQHGDHTEFPGRFDHYVSRALGRYRILTPRDVIGPHPDLVTATVHGAWPTLRDLRGHFILCLSGHATRKATYAGTNPGKRLCFAGAKRVNPPAHGHRAFFNFFMPAGKLDAATRIRILRRFADQGFITRAFGLNDRRAWDRAQRGGANILATDYVTGKRWARAGCKTFEPRDGIRSQQMEC